jgi:SOS-response transcriptional repressor LexA
MDVFSLDSLILHDRKSTYLVKVKGKKKRLNLWPGDILVINKNLELQKNKLGVLVVNGKFCIDIVTEDFIKKNDPENGNFVWGMIQTVVRELK